MASEADDSVLLQVVVASTTGSFISAGPEWLELEIGFATFDLATPATLTATGRRDGAAPDEVSFDITRPDQFGTWPGAGTFEASYMSQTQVSDRLGEAFFYATFDNMPVTVDGATAHLTGGLSIAAQSPAP